MSAPGSVPVVAAVVIAAGASSRMGRPKALLPLRGRTFVARIAAAARAGGASTVLVVVGPPHGEAVRARLPEGVRATWNADPTRGMLSSVQVGIAALEEDVDAALVWPVDTPLVWISTVRRILGAGTARDGHDVTAVRDAARGRLVVPTTDQGGGHPVLIGRRFFDEIAALPLDGAGGLRGLMSAHASDVERLAVADPGVRADVDTPEDYQRLVLRG